MTLSFSRCKDNEQARDARRLEGHAPGGKDLRAGTWLYEPLPIYTPPPTSKASLDSALLWSWFLQGQGFFQDATV